MTPRAPIMVAVSPELLAELREWSEPVQAHIELVASEYRMTFRRPEPVKLVAAARPGCACCLRPLVSDELEPNASQWQAGSPLERRATFVYEAARLQAAAVDAPIVPEPWSQRDDAFRAQFLKIIETYCAASELPTPEQAHGSWWEAYKVMGWVYGERRDAVRKTHPDMVPFDELEQREQDKDAVFLALVEIARDWIRE